MHRTISKLIKSLKNYTFGNFERGNQKINELAIITTIVFQSIKKEKILIVIIVSSFNFNILYCSQLIRIALVGIKNNYSYDNKFENDKNNKRRRIMIVDDDHDIANLFKIFLECNRYTVDAYTNPIKALNNFRKQRYDLIILDLKMPKMDGMTLYNKIKERDDKVITCLTTADKSLIRDLQKGIIDIEKIVIYKPILLKDLKNKIDSLLVNDTYLKH